MKNFNLKFGSGPKGTLMSLLLFFTAYYIKDIICMPEIITNQENSSLSIFIACIVMSILFIVWSVKSLNPKLRGKTLITTGAFKYFRHPLYAAVLSFFNFGLAFFLNNWIFIFWAFSCYPIWHFLVRKEEKMLKDIFPVEYEEYCQNTGKFFPRLFKN